MLDATTAFNEALASYRSGDHDRAVRGAREIVACDARHAPAWHLLGLAQHALGDSTAAIESIRQAIGLDAGQAAFHHNLAEVHRSLGNTELASDAYRNALRLDPRLVQAERSLGGILQVQKNLDESIACFRRALALEPQDARTHCNLGSALWEQGVTNEAARCFQRALELDANLAEAHFNLATVFHKQGQVPQAAACYERAIQAQPDCVPAYVNLGAIYKSQYRLDEAIACYQKALEFQPDFAAAISNLGNAFKLQGRITEAAVCYDQTLRITPDDPQTRFNRALIQLAAGNLTEGWRDYECRFAMPEVGERAFREPRWQGEPLAGRTLLVYSEQGFGDTLQFVRYLPLLARGGHPIIFEVSAGLIPLLSRSGLGDSIRFVPQGEALGDFDLQAALGSLPGIFGTTLENMPATVPYLSADPSLVEQWRGELETQSSKVQAGPDSQFSSSADLALSLAPPFRIGIAWQGRLTYRNDRLRSIPLVRFAPLAQEGVELVSLQKGAGSEQLTQIAEAFHVRNLGEQVDREHGAFMDTAAVMRCLDLVITSDTSIAHLAGALGVEVWVALPLAPDWRWLLEREDCPWYPTMRLFRQTSFDDWRPVFERMAAELRRRVSARGAG